MHVERARLAVPTRGAAVRPLHAIEGGGARTVLPRTPRPLEARMSRSQALVWLRRVAVHV
eukprot:3047878-Prymnesium_polylepis.1